MISKYIQCPFIQLKSLKRHYYFTNHGLHLNMYGKKEYSTLLINMISDLKAEKHIPVITTQRSDFLVKRHHKADKYSY